MAITMTTSGAVVAKSGSGVSPIITANWTTGSEYDLWIEEAEAYLCAITKFDLVTNWASLNAVYKKLFTEFCSRYGAVEAIKYDMSNYTSASPRVEAEDLINVNVWRMQKIEKLLTDASIQDFIGV